MYGKETVALNKHLEFLQLLEDKQLVKTSRLRRCVYEMIRSRRRVMKEQVKVNHWSISTTEDHREARVVYCRATLSSVKNFTKLPTIGDKCDQFER